MKRVLGLNKKLILILLVCLIILSVGIFLALKISKRIAKRQPPALEPVIEQPEEELEEPSKIPLSPAEILERESKIAGEDIAKALVPLPEPKVTKKFPGKPSYRKYKKIDYNTLITMFKEGLEKDQEGKLVVALKGLEYKGIDTVNLLREEILKNFSRPNIRRNAVWGLFYIDKLEVIPVLKTVAKVDPEEDVRLAALFALNALQDKDIIGFLEEISQQDSSERVRQKAKEYIEARNISQ